MTDKDSTQGKDEELRPARYAPDVISPAGLELLARVKTRHPHRTGLIEGIEVTVK